MPTAWLHGNGEPCPACALRREGEDKGYVLRPAPPCNLCGGVGVVPLPDAVIVRRMVAETRRLLWPDLHARLGAEPLDPKSHR